MRVLVVSTLLALTVSAGSARAAYYMDINGVIHDPILTTGGAVHSYLGPNLVPGANLAGTNLADAYLAGANLPSAGLTGANLTGANLTGANLENADLSHADLSNGDLRDANLKNARLVTQDWSARTNLSDVDLRGANLRGANFYGAILSNANLAGAILTTGSDFVWSVQEGYDHGVSMISADLTGVNLSGALIDGFLKLNTAQCGAYPVAAYVTDDTAWRLGERDSDGDGVSDVIEDFTNLDSGLPETTPGISDLDALQAIISNGITTAVPAMGGAGAFLVLISMVASTAYVAGRKKERKLHPRGQLS